MWKGSEALPKRRTGFTEESAANLSTHSIDWSVFLVAGFTPLCIFILKVHSALSLVSLCDMSLPTTQCQLLCPWPSELSRLCAPSTEAAGERRCVSLLQIKWSGLAGALLQEELLWELHLSPQCLYASSVSSARWRSYERGDEEENLSCLLLFPIILFCPCNLLLLPNSLFSASSSIPNTFSSLCLVNSISLYLSVSCHFSLFLRLSPHSQFQVLGFFSLFGFFCFLGVPTLPSSLHLIKCSGHDSIQILFSLRWWGFYGFLKLVVRKNFQHHHHHNFT